MIPFAGYLQRRLRWAAPRTAGLGAGAFAAGVMALILAGLVVSSPRLHGPARLPRLHENAWTHGRPGHRPGNGPLLLGCAESPWPCPGGKALVPARTAGA